MKTISVIITVAKVSARVAFPGSNWVAKIEAIEADAILKTLFPIKIVINDWSYLFKILVTNLALL